MHLLQAVLEHRAIDLVQQFAVDPDLEPGRDAEKAPVEGGVVNLAQRQPIGNDRIATLLRIADDVGGVEQLGVSQSAHRALTAVCVEHLLAEDGLVETLSGHPSGIDLLRCTQRTQIDPDVMTSEGEGELENTG